jgi:hypothetical protein
VVAGGSGFGENHIDVIPDPGVADDSRDDPKQVDLWCGTAAVCEGRVGEQSIWAVLYHQGDRLFGDELFGDLFAEVGRRSVPPRIVATVMVLQRLQGLSDREAVEAFSFDARWKYACGGLAFDYPGFSHTVLVDMRARLAASARPERIFAVTMAAARQAGLVGVRRVLDSTPLYDAVATMDTVTLLGAAIRGLLKVAEEGLAAELRGVLAGADDYAGLAKPQIDWDDQAARAALVDARARDAHAVLGVLQGRPLPAAVAQAARLLGAIVGQDLEQGDDGSFRMARKVAADRVISVVDPDARHGHKSSARGFDGYKGHASVDPDSELVTATTATAGNLGDAAAAPQLLAELIDQVDGDRPTPTTASEAGVAGQRPRPPSMVIAPMAPGHCWPACTPPGSTRGSRSKPRLHPKDTSPRTSSSSTLPWARSPAPPSAPPRSSTTPIHATATTAKPASARRVRPARCAASAPARRLAAPSPSPPTSTSWRLPAPARPTRSAPPTTAQPGPRWSASWPIWSAAATAAVVCGSAALPGSPPTSACWLPRSTWPGWACSVCTGPQRTAGQQHDPTGVPTRRPWRSSTSATCAIRQPRPRPPIRRQQARTPHNPNPTSPFHTSHLGRVSWMVSWLVGPGA